MKKRWRIAILAAVGLGMAVFAVAGWLGFLPFGRPDNEHDFMAEQLRRVRYAGPLRSDDEKAIAALLPDNPTIDDLRVAYGRHWLDMDRALNRAFVKAHPERGRVGWPPKDEAARRALDECNATCTALEQRYVVLDWLQDDGKGWATNVCEAFVAETEGIVDRLARATPAAGQILTKYDPTDPLYDLPQNFAAAMRICVVRVRCLYATGQAEQGWLELLKVADFSCRARIAPTLIGESSYDLQNTLLLDDAALALASLGQFTLAQLEELVAKCRLHRTDVYEIARVEFAIGLTAAHDTEAEYLQYFVSDLTAEAFVRYGSSSLRHWLEQERANRTQRLEQWQERLAELAATGVSMRDEKGAEVLLATGVAGRGHWVTDQNKLLVTAASCLADSEGRLLALKLHLLKQRNPQGWQTRAAEVAREFPFARIEYFDQFAEVRRHDNHKALLFLGGLDRIDKGRLMATVR